MAFGSSNKMSAKGKSSRLFTVLVIPDRDGKVRRFSLPEKVVSWGIGFVAFVSLLLVSLFGTFVYYRHIHKSDMALRLENQKYRREMDELRTKLSSVESYMERVRRFDQKIRMITNLEDSERHVALGPIEQESSLPETPGVKVASLTPDVRAPTLGNEFSARKAVERVDETQERLDRLNEEAARQESSLQELENSLRDMGSLLRATPAVWPSVGWVTSTFGFRVSPFSGQRTMHEGLDIAARPGTIVKSPADGIVTFAGTHGSYGKTVVINHGYGTITRYGHLSEFFVKMGETVKRGSKIAAVGNTGRSTGPHLHYEVVVNGVPRDPMKYILE